MGLLLFWDFMGLWGLGSWSLGVLRSSGPNTPRAPKTLTAPKTPKSQQLLNPQNTKTPQKTQKQKPNNPTKTKNPKTPRLQDLRVHRWDGAWVSLHRMGRAAPGSSPSLSFTGALKQPLEPPSAPPKNFVSRISPQPQGVAP